MNNIFVWIGNRNTCLWRFRLAAGFLTNIVFWRKVYMCQKQLLLVIFDGCVDFCKHQVDG